MTVFVIAGRTDCKLFCHALYVANFLSKHLPNFKIQILGKAPTEWEIWLHDINKKNKWYHQNSPVIWKELTMLGGKAHLIGGLSEFWEYCYDYYGLVSILSKEDIRNLTRDYIQYFGKRHEMTSGLLNEKKYMTVFITGNQTKFITSLVAELLNMKDFFKGIILNVKIYNQSNDNTWQAITEDITELSILSVCTNFKFDIVSTVQDGLHSSDLMIITGDYARKKNEDFYSWLERNNQHMVELSDKISTYAKRDIRIIIAMHGPVCFNAVVLAETATKIQIHNIVAVTADIGLEVLNIVSQMTDLPLKDLGAPPVWGFIGINQIVDIEHIVQRYDVFRPNSRAIKSKTGSTLPKGKKCAELRFLDYRTSNLNHIWRKIENSKQFVSHQLGRSAYLPKIRAIISLVKNWYVKDNDNIISLGILSNGSFGIPAGLVFSQPVILQDEKWVPMQTFPTPREDPFNVKQLLPFITEILHYFKYSSATNFNNTNIV